MKASRSVIVIGGGVIGVCSAYYLARKGWSVTLVEKGDICTGSSYGNAGLIVPSHCIPLAAPGVFRKAVKWMGDPESPFYIRPRLDSDLVAWLWKFRAACTERRVHQGMPIIRDLTYASLALFREFAAIDGFGFGYRQGGLLGVFRTEEGHAEAAQEAQLLSQAGVPARILDAAATREVEPSLLPGIVGGVLFPDDAQLVPDAFVTGLARIVEKMGARILTSTEVLGFQTAGRRIGGVETTRGDLAAEHIVLAAGAWSPLLVRALGLTLPIQPAKGYSVTYRRRSNGPRIPLMLGEARVVVTPMAETLRFAGTLELAGFDLTINRRRVNAILNSAAKFVGDLDGHSVVEIWRGLRPCTPDGLPIIGRSERFANLILATGHGMLGVSLGPITGKLVAQLASGDEPMVDLALLKPERF